MQNPGLAAVQGARVFVYFFFGFFLGGGDMSSIGALEGFWFYTGFGFGVWVSGFRVVGFRGLGFSVSGLGVSRAG